MEKTKESIEKALNLLNIQREKKDIILKEEQENAVVELLFGKDVLAILPTGFRKSLIYTIFALASTDLRSAKTSVLVISPFKSLIDDQIAEMESLGCKSLARTHSRQQRRLPTVQLNPSRKRSSNPRNLKTLALRFRVEYVLKTEVFENGVVTIVTTFP